MMNKSLHYLLMTDYLLFQKALYTNIKETELTMGQPKILDYLLYHDGSVQKEIAEACHIEPASMTSVLLGMEKKSLIYRKNLDGNRRSLYVYLTEKGRFLAEQVAVQFSLLEERALDGFDDNDKERLLSLLSKMRDNMNY